MDALLETRPSKLFLTGKIGVGKSTILRRVIETLGVRAVGFVTERVYGEPGAAVPRFRSAGRPVAGFDIRCLATGRTAPIARFDAGGNLVPLSEGFETVGADALEFSPPSRSGAQPALVVMDEIGFLENESPRFREAVLRALAGPLPVFGVLKEMDPTNEFIRAVKAEATRLLKVTERNRDEVEKTAREVLSARLLGGAS